MAAKNAGYRKPTGAEQRAIREQLAQAEVDPAVEAHSKEQSFLRAAQTAQDDLIWLINNEAWSALGFDTFADWWDARVSPVLNELPMLRPTREVAQLVIDRVRAEDEARPKSQRRTSKQLAAMVGLSAPTVRRSSSRSLPRSGDAESDLEETPPVIDVEPTNVTDEPTTEPAPADVPDAMTQAITEVAGSVGAGVTMPPARPAESPCSDAPDRAHCAVGGCGADLSGNEQAAGHLRCRSCDPLTLHKANGIGVEEGYGECDECAIQARIADRTSAASVAAANTGGVFPPVGEPDVDVEAASTSGTQTAAGPEVEVSPSPAVGSYGVGALHDPGVSAVPAAGTPVPDGDGDGSVAVRDNPEERIEEESASPRERIPLPVYCHDCKSIDERCEQHRDSSAATFSSTAAFRLISPAADPIEPSHAGVPAAGGYPESLDDLGCPLCEYVVEVSEEDPDASLSEMVRHFIGGHGLDRDEAMAELARVRTISPAADTSDTESQVVLQQSGPDSPAGAGIFSDPEVPAVATARPEIDHHTSAGVSDSGVAPEVRASVEPVLEGGGLAPDPSSSSDPEPHPGDRLLHALGVLVHLIDELDPEALGPYLFPGEVELLHLHADRIAEFVGRVGLARTQLAGNP